MEQPAESGMGKEFDMAARAYENGEKDAFKEKHPAIHRFLNECSPDYRHSLSTKANYYQRKKLEDYDKALIKEHRDAEPLRIDKLDILARHPDFYRLLDEIKKKKLGGPICDYGNKGVLIGAGHVMIRNNYFKKCMNGKKVKLKDIIEFLADCFEVDDLEELKRYGKAMDKYVAKAYATLETLKTNEQKH